MEATERQRGRPRARRTRRGISVYVDDDLRVEIEGAAERLDVPVTRWIEAACVAALDLAAVRAKRIRR